MVDSEKSAGGITAAGIANYLNNGNGSVRNHPTQRMIIQTAAFLTAMAGGTATAQEALSHFRAYGLDGEVLLTWADPGTSATVRIQRQAETFPAAPEDGVTVYDGSAASLLDAPTTNGLRLFYGAFVTRDGMASTTPTLASATPRPESGFDPAPFAVSKWAESVDVAAGDDWGYGAALTSGTLYVAGYATSGPSRLLHLQARDFQDGSVLWPADNDTPTSAGVWFDVATDSGGNVIATGYHTAQTPYQSAILTRKYDPAGGLLWEQIYFNGTGNQGRAVATDAQDNIYVAGFIMNGSGENDQWAILKYGPDGTPAAGFPITYDYSSNASLEDLAFGIGVDPGGRIIAAGQRGEPAEGSSDWHVRAWSADRDLLWEDTYSGAGGSVDAAQGVYIDGNGDVYVAGYAHTGSDIDMLVIKYAAVTGTRVWARTFPGIPGRSDVAYCVGPGRAGEILVGGHRASANNVRHARLLRVSASHGSRTGEWTSPLEGSVFFGLAVEGESVIATGYGNGIGGRDILLQALELRLSSPLWMIQ